MDFYTEYYKGLEGATILRFKGMDKEPEEFGDGFPVFIVRFADKSIREIAISQDPEGNGGGFIFGLPQA